MKLSLPSICFLILLPLVTFAKIFNFPIKVTNVSKETLTLAYQTGYVLNASNQGINMLGTLTGNAEITYPSVTAESGQKVFILSYLNGSYLVVNTITIANKKPKDLSVIVDKPLIDNSNDPAQDRTGLDALLAEVGADNIGEGNLRRMKVSLAASNAMATICGALVIIDPAVINKSGEFTEAQTKNLIESYYLNSAPTKVILQGGSIKKTIEYDNSSDIAGTASFPLAGNFNLNMSGADYYKIVIEAKEAGWSKLEYANAASYSERIAALSEIRQLAIAQKVQSALKECPTCKVYPVTSVYYYESLTATTTKYNRISGSADASVSSVVSTRGAYKRDES